MAYEHDMTGEGGRLEVEDGWHEFVISDCREETSKQGNEMFVFTLIHKETEQAADVYAVAVKGKRWFLKQILIAAGVSAGQDGVYKWDIPEVINKTIMGKVKNAPETFINRDGEEQTVTKSKIVEAKAV